MGYLDNATHKTWGHSMSQTFYFWLDSFYKINEKKQKLNDLQLAWQSRQSRVILHCWQHLSQANTHWKKHQKLKSFLRWRQLFCYHIAARYERQKHLSLRVHLFDKWRQYTQTMRQQQFELDELFETWTDNKRRKVFGKWKRIWIKYQRANRLYALTLQQNVFRKYIECVAVSKCETEKQHAFASQHYATNLNKKYFYFWWQCFDQISQKNEFLNRKCDKFLKQKGQNLKNKIFKAMVNLFHERMNERNSMLISAQYHNQRIVSKLFVEWKLVCRTRKFKAKLLTKSLCSLRVSMSKSGSGFGGIGVSKVSASQPYIRLSHSNLFEKEEEFTNYLKHKSEDDNEMFDSVLLRTPNWNDRLNDSN